ncbi:MAG: transposase, partial [Gemmatimonadaceae bacterium]
PLASGVWRRLALSTRTTAPLTEEVIVLVSEFCRQKGFNEGTFYKWKKRFGSMQVAEVKRLRELESENARLKRLLADRLIEIDAMQELLAKKW